MSVELLFEQAGKFQGSFPDIQTPSDVSLAELGADAFFVTLPVGRVNAKSRGSGRVYTESAVKCLVRQINEKRPEGRYGHLAVSELATRYDPPAIQWLAAELVDGVAWAKGLPLTEQARKHFRDAKAMNARVGTSVFGPPPTAEGNRVIDLELYSIDIADPARVGIQDAAAQPNLTSEMETSQMEINEQLLTEMKGERDAALQRVGTLETTNTQLTEQVADLQGKLSGVTKAQTYVSEMADSYISMGININASGPDLEQVIREMTTKLMALQAGELIGKINAAVTEMVKLESLQPLVSEMLVDPETQQPKVKSLDEAKTRISAYLERPSVKALAQRLVSEQAGPNLILSVKPNDNHGDGWRDTIAAAAVDKAKQTK